MAIQIVLHLSYAETYRLTSTTSLLVLLLESDVELAVDHLTRLILEEEDPKVRLVPVFSCSGRAIRSL